MRVSVPGYPDVTVDRAGTFYRLIRLKDGQVRERALRHVGRNRDYVILDKRQVNWRKLCEAAFDQAPLYVEIEGAVTLSQQAWRTLLDK